MRAWVLAGVMLVGAGFGAGAGAGFGAWGQQGPTGPPGPPKPVGPLDLGRDMAGAVLEGKVHTPLAEEYLWTAGEVQQAGVDYDRTRGGDRNEHHYFRRVFAVGAVPKVATLYVAGPRWAKVWVNGTLADEVSSDPGSPLGMHVYTTNVSRLLRAGKNTVALEVVRGRGVFGFGNDAKMKQQTRGLVVVAKIVGAGPGVQGKALMMSDGQWKSTVRAGAGWEGAGFDDAAWPAALSFGGIESGIELFQWNADAGLYEWPGYDGISPFLARKRVGATKVVTSFEGRNKLVGLEALTGGAGEFGVRVGPMRGDEDGASVLLDFGRELTGRLEVVSDSDATAQMTVQYGESEGETTKAPYLGVNVLTVGPHATAYGAKTAFRFAKVRFMGGGPELRFKSIAVDHIFYPVTYAGSFESSDAELNKIWEVGAYTVHLCMQDGLWDSPKRDRGRWSGDDDVSQRVVNDVFGDRMLPEETMERLVGESPVKQHVNGIPGYSSFWVTQVAEYYRHTGSMEFLRRVQGRMVELLNRIDADFDERNLFANKGKAWLFVDWSPELNGDTSESRRASQFEFYRAYVEGVWLLRELGDEANARKFEGRAAALKEASNTLLKDRNAATYGPRWQTNAMAVLSGVAGEGSYPEIWDGVLSKVGESKYLGLIISPYYNYYVISAMAEMGHRAEALQWIKRYWGGMIAEGATSYWEGYDNDWYKGDPHASLQSDNQTGYRTSLAHGWSAGPTAWLMEEMLGIKSTGAGFKTVSIRPDLMGLAWAKGAEPTPRGLLKVDVMPGKVTVELPEGVEARVSLAGTSVKVNGVGRTGESAEGGARRVVVLRGKGSYVLEVN